MNFSCLCVCVCVCVCTNWVEYTWWIEFMWQKLILIVVIYFHPKYSDLWINFSSAYFVYFSYKPIMSLSLSSLYDRRHRPLFRNSERSDIIYLDFISRDYMIDSFEYWAVPFQPGKPEREIFLKTLHIQIRSKMYSLQIFVSTVCPVNFDWNCLN